MGAEELEQVVLGGPLDLDRDEVAALAGVPEPQARAVWTAMGFAEVPQGEKAFTRQDAEALRLAARVLGHGSADVDTLLVLARTTGQAMSRLAESHVGVLPGLVDDPTAATSAGELLPELEQLVLYVWRRQLAAALGRHAVAARQPGLPVLAVGFVDLVEFTRTSREYTAPALERLLERFERDTSLRVASAGGRVVKMLGDAVLWVSEDPAAVAEVALATVQAHSEDPELPDVRAGIAMGPVLARLGDVYGPPVNLASRLTEEARPGSVLVDLEAATALSADPRWELHRVHARAVRGYRALRPSVLRRRT